MKKNFTNLLGLAGVFLIAAFSMTIGADSPAMEHLKTHIASLQQVLLDPKLAGKENLPQRRRLERVILQQLFDFDEMARRSLGADALRYRDRLSEFTPLFIDFLEHAYMGTLEENGDAKIQYVKEIGGNENSQILTKTRLKDGREYRVDYKLLLSPQGWRAYDVTVEGVSLVDNYRAQFARVLQRHPFDQLLQDLREKRGKFS